MIELLCLIGGMLIGVVITTLYFNVKTSGTLNIIRDEDGEYMFVELKHGLSDVHGKHVVKFLINDQTQK